MERYELLVSEEKSKWRARQVMVWTGFVFDTRKFSLFVTLEKFKKADQLLDRLKKDTGIMIEV